MGKALTQDEKEERFIERLKFTPIRVRLLIQGYGGECYIGTVKREDYEVFKTHRVDLDQYLGDWDNELFQDIPEKNRFVDPGNAYDCDNLFHQSGATMDDGSYLTVINDDTNEDIFETNLDAAHLEEQGISVECVEDFESADLEPGSVIFWGGQGEKGCFFDAEFTLTRPFDPKLLKITYGNGDGWYIVGGVEYDGVELEGYDGYSTTGKWSEHKFWIAGDEEVYAGEERDEDFESKDVEVLEGEEEWAQRAIDESMLSTWHTADLVPAHEGEYEVEFAEVKWPYSKTGYHEFRDGRWDVPEGLKIKQWRGLKEPA